MCPALGSVCQKTVIVAAAMISKATKTSTAPIARNNLKCSGGKGTINDIVPTTKKTVQKVPAGSRLNLCGR